jgi:hypothetical protein
MVIDPPYGVGYDPSWRARRGRRAGKLAHGKVLNECKRVPPIGAIVASAKPVMSGSGSKPLTRRSPAAKPAMSAGTWPSCCASRAN